MRSNNVGTSQFATSITSSRNSLRRAQQDKYAVPGYSASHALFGRAFSSGGKKRTPFRLTMSGVLKLFIPHSGKSDKTDRNAEVRYTAGTRSFAGSEILNCAGQDRRLRTITGRTNTHTA